MARLFFCFVLPLLTASGARLAEDERRAPAASLRASGAIARAAAGLPEDVVRRVLDLACGPPLVAWDTGDDEGVLVFRPGGEHPSWRVDTLIRVMRFFQAGDKIFTWPGLGRDAQIRSAWTGRPLRTIGPQRIRDVQVFSRGDRLATLDFYGSAVIWDAASGVALQRLDVEAQSDYLRVFGEARLATWGWDARAIIWDLATGRSRHEVRQPEGRVFFLEASPEGSKLLTRAFTGAEVYVWDADAGHLLRGFRTVGYHCRQASISHGGARVIVESRDEVFVWSGVAGQFHRRIKLWGHLLLLPGGRYIAAINASEAAVWDAETGARVMLETDALLLQRLARTGGPELAVSSCGRVLAACANQLVERTYRDVLAVWDTRSGILLSKDERPHGRPGSPCGVAVASTVMLDEVLA